MDEQRNEPTLEEIERVMEEQVRPELALHDGNIQIESYADGVLDVRLLGQCSNCPSAGYTMETIVEEKIHEAFPQIKEIKLTTGVSDSLIEEALAMLRSRHKES